LLLLNKLEKNMSDERFLVTGALGCIGAWVVRLLVRQGIPVSVFDLGSDPHRLRLILSADELASVNFIQGDITDTAQVHAAFQNSSANRVIHLAALQVPFCKADPVLGARVNVVGSVNLFEAVKKAGLKHLVYASSVAVFGSSEDYPEGALASDAVQHPRNHYGVYKQANEGTARIYWQDDGISSIGLRPYTVYGAGRDQGMTSGPTKAMLAAAAGKPYQIPFGGRGSYQYVEDVARIFIQATRLPFQGAEVFNMRGSVVHVKDIIAAIEAVEPSAQGLISYAEKPLPLPEELDDASLRTTFGELNETSLRSGVMQTLEIFRQALSEGHISLPSLG
jgi:UDP-glucuronate 4-epimerase